VSIYVDCEQSLFCSKICAGQATSSTGWRVSEERKERLPCFHTAFLKPGTLVTECFDWSVYDVMMCICHQHHLETCSACQIFEIWLPSIELLTALRRKNNKFLDTKLTVSRGAIHTYLTVAEFSHLLHNFFGVELLIFPALNMNASIDSLDCKQSLFCSKIQGKNLTLAYHVRKWECHVIDTNCLRASEMRSESRAVSFFRSSLPLRPVLPTALPLAAWISYLRLVRHGS